VREVAPAEMADGLIGVVLPGHVVVEFWAALAALVVGGRAGGSLARRLGQPPVVGELVAGLVLGPSVLGALFPSAERFLFPSGAAGVPLAGVVTVALAFVLLAAGLETDIELIRRLGRPARTLSVASFAIPFVLAAVVVWRLPRPVGPGSEPVLFIAFMALAVAVSSLPIIARLVGDSGASRRSFGQLCLAVGSVHDTVGFIVLGVLAALARRPVSLAGVGLQLGGLVGLAVVVVVLGQPLLDVALRRSRKGDPAGGEAGAAGTLGTSVGLGIAAAALTQAAGLEGALGAFVVGVGLRRSRFGQEEVRARLAAVTSGLFAPLYFASAGLSMRVEDLFPPRAALGVAVLLVVALVGKALGAEVGGRRGGLAPAERLALAAGLNGRGSLQVVVATAALSAGVFGTTAFTAVLVVSVVSSLLAAPVVRYVVDHWPGTEAEQQRLRYESQLAANVVLRPDRVLLPTLGSPNSIVAAELVELAWPEATAVTVLTVAEANAQRVGAEVARGPESEPESSMADRPRRGSQIDEAGVEAVVAVLEGRGPHRRRVAGIHPLQAILEEARLGYGAIAVGAAERPAPGHLLSPVVDDLLLESPVPVLVARRAELSSRPGGSLPAAFSRVLVPVSGDPESRAAQELAFGLAARLGSEIVLVHVLPGETARDDGERARGELAAAMFEDAEAMAGALGARTVRLLREGDASGRELIAAARETRADLVVVGATARRAGAAVFLGHDVEMVLADVGATVAAIILPRREVERRPRDGSRAKNSPGMPSS